MQLISFGPLSQIYPSVSESIKYLIYKYLMSIILALNIFLNIIYIFLIK